MGDTSNPLASPVHAPTANTESTRTGPRPVRRGRAARYIQDESARGVCRKSGGYRTMRDLQGHAAAR